MKFQKNILGLAVVAGTLVMIGGNAYAVDDLAKPDALNNVVTVANTRANTFAAANGQASFNAMKNAYDTNVSAQADLVAAAKAVTDNATATALSQSKIIAALAMTSTAVQASTGLTGAEILKAEDVLLGQNRAGTLTSGGYRGGLAALVATQTTKATAAATSQAAVDVLTAGGISAQYNIALANKSAAATQSATNGTVANGATAKTLGKISFDATATLGTVNTVVATTTSIGNGTALYLATHDADKTVLLAQAALAASTGGTTVVANTFGYGGTGGAVAAVTGVDRKDLFVLLGKTTLDIRSGTKQLSWTVNANAATANSGTLANLVTALNADTTWGVVAAINTNVATSLELTYTGSSTIGTTWKEAATAALGNDARWVTMDTLFTSAAGANDGIAIAKSIASNAAITGTALVEGKASYTVTYDILVANKQVAAAAALTAQNAGLAAKTTATAGYNSGVTVKTSFETIETAAYSSANTKLQGVAAVVQEELAVQTAVTAGLEATAAAKEVISAADLVDVTTTASAKTTAVAATVSAQASFNAAVLANTGAGATTATAQAVLDAQVTLAAATIAQATATSAATLATNVLYGTGLTSATAIASQTGTNKTAVTKRALVTASQAITTVMTSNSALQASIASDAANPAGALQASLILGTDTGAGVVAAVNANYQSQKTFDAKIAVNTSGVAANTASIGTNAATLVTHAGLVTTNIANIATNTAGVATNTATLVTHAGLVTTNIANIATNTGNIAANTASIGSFGANISANTSALADISRRMSKDSDMLKSGIASALAIAGMPTAPGEGMGFSIGAGGFDGESAIAMGITFVSENKAFKLSVGNSGGETSASAGAAFKF